MNEQLFEFQATWSKWFNLIRMKRKLERIFQIKWDKRFTLLKLLHIIWICRLNSNNSNNLNEICINFFSSWRWFYWKSRLEYFKHHSNALLFWLFIFISTRFIFICEGQKSNQTNCWFKNIDEWYSSIYSNWYICDQIISCFSNFIFQWFYYCYHKLLYSKVFLFIYKFFIFLHFFLFKKLIGEFMKFF